MLIVDLSTETQLLLKINAYIVIFVDDDDLPEYDYSWIDDSVLLFDYRYSNAVIPILKDYVKGDKKGLLIVGGALLVEAKDDPDSMYVITARHVISSGMDLDDFDLGFRPKSINTIFLLSRAKMKEHGLVWKVMEFDDGTEDYDLIITKIRIDQEAEEKMLCKPLPYSIIAHGLDDGTGIYGFMVLGYPHGHSLNLGQYLRKTQANLIKINSAIKQITAEFMNMANSVETMIPLPIPAVPYQDDVFKNTNDTMVYQSKVATYVSGSPIFAILSNNNPVLAGICLSVNLLDKPGPYETLSAKERKKYGDTLRVLKLGSIQITLDAILEKSPFCNLDEFRLTDFREIVTFKV